MLSQLCRARPWTISKKLTPTQSAQQCPPAIQQCLPNENDIPPSSNEDGDNRCQLLHCSFCDYRVCCLVTPCLRDDWEEGNHSSETTFCSSKSTENPAYGLSSENFLEVPDHSSDNCSLPVKELQLMEQTTTKSSGNSPNNSEKVNSSSKSGLEENNDAASQAENVRHDGTTEMNNNNSSTLCSDKRYKSQEKKPAGKFTICQKVIGSREEYNWSQFDNGELDCAGGGGNMREAKSCGRIWSVLKHREMKNGAFKSCDNKCDENCVIFNPKSSDKLCDCPSQAREAVSTSTELPKSSVKCNNVQQDKSQQFYKPSVPSEEMKKPNPLPNPTKVPTDPSRPRKFATNIKEKYAFDKTRTPHIVQRDMSKDSKRSDICSNGKLTEITKVKTEESIQEWLQRISEWVDNNSWIKDSCDELDDSDESPTNSHRRQTHRKRGTRVPKIKENPARLNQNQPEKHFLEGETVSTDSKDPSAPSDNPPENSKSQEEKPKEESIQQSTKNVYEILSNATKESPANIPMVVMQCSRLHSHINSTPPFQQTSLPMGTLVTALYQESDWFYVQTPHGVEGFVCSSNCSPIGTVNDSSHSSKRPWEPCDFPIQISIRGPCDPRVHQGAFVSAKLPINGCRQAGPYVSTVKMKTNFYNDGYFNNTFKPKDSIKTAKTVTDILRSSPDTKISNQ